MAKKQYGKRQKYPHISKLLLINRCYRGIYFTQTRTPYVFFADTGKPNKRETFFFPAVKNKLIYDFGLFD